MRLAAVIIRLCVFWGVVVQVATSGSRSGRKKGAAGRRTRQVFRAEPVEGVWSQWGAWSECTQTCGVGVSQRTRDCNAPPLPPPPQTPPLSHAPPNWGGYFPPAASSRPYSRPSPSYYQPPPVSTNRSPGGLPLYRTDPIGAGGGGEGGGPLLPGGAAANHPSRRFYQPDFSSSPTANQDPAVSVYRSPYHHRSGTAHGYNQPTRITRRPTNPGSQPRPGGGAGGGTRREGLNSRRSPIRPGQFGYGRVPFSLPLHRQTRHTANGTVDEDTPTGAPPAAHQDDSDAAAPMGAPVGGGAKEGEGGAGGNNRETGGGGGGGGGGEDAGRNQDVGQHQQEEAKTEESAGPPPASGRAREREQRAPPPFPPPSSRAAASAAAARRTFDWHSVAAPPPPPRGHAPPHSSSSHPYSSSAASSSSADADAVPPPPFSSPLHRAEPHPPPPQHHQHGGEAVARQHTCSGRPTEFRRCFSQVCAGAADSRSTQCSAFNNQEFMGRYYNWEPFTEVGPDKQCELTCRPVGYRFYVVQAETVRDGTPCVNTSTNDVCVAGQCLTEGCDGVLGSGSAVDRCGVCGGGQRSCRKVTGSFLNSTLPLGYNKMLTLPAGATHLNVTERHASSNYLALRSGTGVSVVNGRWAVDAPGSYQGGGTTFTYTRPRASSSGQQEGGESLTAPGPTTTILHLYIIFHKQNPGVDYEFYVPAEKDAESERPKEREVATLERERPREREVTVERERHRERDGGRSPLRSANPLTVSVEEDAPPLPPPVSLPSFPGSSSSSDRWTADRSRPRGSAPNRNARIPPRTDVPLDTQPPFVWKRRGFTQCSVSCGKGSQYRVVVCVDRHSDEELPERKCDSAAKPLPEEEPCNTQACPAFWEASAWSECSVSCGQGLQQRQLQCRQTFGNRSTMVHPTHCSTLRPPASTQPCQTSLCSHWEVGSDWSACSVDCGIGKRTRSVRCVSDDGNDVSDTECRSVRPPGSEECNMGQCVTNWYFTDWSKTCSAECGPGVDRREVVCLTGGAGADRGEGGGGGDCVGDKPAEMKACNGGPCVSVNSWYSSPWSQCNVRCGNGTQRRDVICVRKAGSDLGVVPPGECRTVGDKPPAVKECHMVNCPPAWFTTEWTACSSSCGEGMQVREVRCLTQDKQHSPDCEGDFKPPHRQICNILPCSPQLPDENCRDRRHNCVMVVQARLCVYSYYKTSCCASCTQNAQRSKRH